MVNQRIESNQNFRFVKIPTPMCECVFGAVLAHACKSKGEGPKLWG